MSNYKVSIVIPAYNAEKTLSYCLESILNSDYDKNLLEVLVIDNNSQDNSKNLINSFPVRYILETKQGRSFARNRGIKEATGDFIAFLDADTYIESNWISNMVALISRKDIGGGQGQVIPSTRLGSKSLNNFRYESIKKDTSGEFSILPILCFETPMINSAACMYKVEAVRGVGGFDTTLERHEDIDLAKRVFYSGYNLAATNKAVAHVHYHGEGWLDYFQRSFRDGYTKNDYVNKWSKYKKEVSSIKRAGTTESSHQIKSNASGIGTFIWVVKENTKMFIKTFKLFYIIRILLTFSQAFGRVWGKLTIKDNRKAFSIERQKTYSVNLSIPGNLEFNEDYLYTFFDECCYAINTVTGEVYILRGFEYDYIKILFSESDEDVVDQVTKKFLAAMNKQLTGRYLLRNTESFSIQ